MDFIVTHWYAWLIVAIICYGYVLYNQVRRMKNMVTNLGSGFFDGIVSMIVLGLVGTGASVLLLIVIVVNIIKYVK